MAHRASKNLLSLAVLVVDNNEAHCRHLTTLLGGLGVRRITTVDDPADALREAKRLHPDVIFCRYHMEPVGGVDFAQMIRNSPESPDPFVPVVMLVDDAGPDEIAAAKGSGVDDLLAMPVSGKALSAHLTKLFDHQRVFVRTANYFGPEIAGPDDHKIAG